MRKIIFRIVLGILLLGTLSFSIVNVEGDIGFSTDNTDPNPCPMMPCSIEECPYGCFVDDRGCPTGECLDPNPCPAMPCDITECPYGCKVNEAGCMTGECNPASEDGLGTVSCKKGCICKGDAITCPVENEAIDVEVDEGPTQGQTGEQDTGTITAPISITKQGDKVKIKSGDVEAVTLEDVSVRDSKLTMETSNGRNAEIKIMPETASETAITRLGELNFTVELKEVGKGDEAKPVYELTGEKQGRFLGIFKIMARVQAQVDAGNGEIIKVIKPWWSFLASGI